jgi:hypothetical protein
MMLTFWGVGGAWRRMRTIFGELGDNKDEVYALKRVQVRIMASADEG